MAKAIQLFLDEDAQRTALVRALQARHIDVLTVNASGRTGLSDEEQLAFAAEMGRTIFTFNRRHFVKLHIDYLRQDRHHAGIIVSDQHEIGTLIRRLLRLIDAKQAGEMQDRLEFLSNWG